MGKKTPQAPTPPDPAQTAAAQTQSNVATAQEQQRLNMVGSYGPDGSVSWRADPNSPGGYSQYTELSPGQQSIYDAGNQAQVSALGVANDQIGRVGSALDSQLRAPDLAYAPNTPSLSRVDHTPQYQQDFGYQSAQKRLDPRFDDSGLVMGAQYAQAASRLNPMWDQREERLQTQLANQGLDRNSTAYQTALGDFGRDRNDAYNQAVYSAIGTGADRQNQLYGQGLSSAQLYNQGVGQDYTQNLGAASFRNDTAGRGYGDYLNQVSTNNQIDQQSYANALQNAQFNNERASQDLQNQAYVQNQPLNQFNSLMSSSQVAMPQGFGYTPSQVAGTNVAGIYQNDYQNQLGAYQTKMQNQQSQMGGLFGLGGAVLGGLAGNPGLGYSLGKSLGGGR